MNTWRRSEPRLARPFFAVASIDEALNGARIMLGDREIEMEDDVIQLDPADFEGLRLTLAPNVDEHWLREALGEKTDAVSLILSI